MNTLSIVKSSKNYYVKQTDSEGTLLALFELDRAGHDFDNIDIGYVGEWIDCLDLGQIEHEEDYEGFFEIITDFTDMIAAYKSEKKTEANTPIEQLAKEIAKFDSN